ncbi:MAG: uroporphyrinogen decarboxylase family protein [Desulfamplus sp.]|nr:uroporphyrinogen decarboxylase family protein [Desulfamplus sp.]
MNSLERVLGKIEGSPTDYPAVTLTLSLYGARLTKYPLKEYYTRADAYIEGQIAVKETFNPDIIFTPFALTAEGESFGSKVKFFEKNPPNISRYAAKSPDDVLSIDLPDVNSHPRLCFIRDAIRGIAAKYGKNTAICGVMLSPIDLPPLIMGIDGWLETLLFDQDNAKRIIDMTTQFFLTWSKAMFEDGVHFIALPIVFCNPAIVTDSIIQNITFPALKNAVSNAAGPVVLHHGGAPMFSSLEMLVSIPNVAAYAIDHRDDFKTARDIVGSNKVLLGNIDGPTLYSHNIQDIEQMTYNILNDRKDDSHFILASSSADIAFDTPPENINAVIKAARTNTLHKISN